MIRTELYLSVYSALLLIMVGCTTLSWSSPMLVKLSSSLDNPIRRPITSLENSLLASLGTLGICVGCSTCGPLASKYGRRTILILLCFPLLIFYSVMLFSSKIFLFYVSRIGTGFGTGGALVVGSMYVGELAPPDKRGFLGVSLSVFINIGLLIPYSIGPFVSFFSFHVILCFLSGILIPFIYLFAKESPYYVFIRDQTKAESILKQLLKTNEVKKELQEIHQIIYSDVNQDFYDTLKSKESKRAFLIVLGGYTFANFVGSEVISAYNQSIFESAGDILKPEIGPIAVGIAQLVSSFVTSLVADKCPRKVLYSIAHAGVALAEIPFGIYFFMKENDHDVTGIYLLPLICLVLYALFYNIGITPIIMTLVGELFPARIKGVAIAFSTAYFWITAFLLTFLFKMLTEQFGMAKLFWFFSAIGFCAVVFINTCIIETKGKTLREIQDKLREC